MRQNPLMVAKTTPSPLFLRKLTPSLILCDRSDIDRECCANLCLQMLPSFSEIILLFSLPHLCEYLTDPGVLGAEVCCMCLGSADRVLASRCCLSVFCFTDGDGGGVPDFITISWGWIQRCSELLTWT